MKDITPKDLAGLVIQGFIIGYLFPRYFGKAATEVSGALFHQKPFGASEIMTFVVLAACIYLCVDTWRKYIRIKRILFPPQVP